MIKFVKMFYRYGPALMLAMFLFSEFFIPNSLWLEVGRVHVFDTMQYVSPKMAVSRIVNRPFRGHWVVTVKKAQNELVDGGYYAECTASGENDYHPETKLPANLDLDWWTFPRSCSLPSGAYVVDTTWTFRALMSERSVRAVSNVFLVK